MRFMGVLGVRVGFFAGKGRRSRSAAPVSRSVGRETTAEPRFPGRAPKPAVSGLRRSAPLIFRRNPLYLIGCSISDRGLDPARRAATSNDRLWRGIAE